jgi:hypothetical protein
MTTLAQNAKQKPNMQRHTAARLHSETGRNITASNEKTCIAHGGRVDDHFVDHLLWVLHHSNASVNEA